MSTRYTDAAVARKGNLASVWLPRTKLRAVASPVEHGAADFDAPPIRASGGVAGSSKALWKLKVQGRSSLTASALAPLEWAISPAESHCLMSNASSQVIADQ